MKKLTIEEFIQKSNNIHGDEYDYSNTIYTNAKTKLKIICKKHGEFFMLPHNHLKGEGCPVCRYEKSSEKNRYTLEEFIEKAKQVHGDKYDYSKVKYMNNSTKVCIICPEHGEFWQTPNKHILRKQGCPHCSGNARKTLEEFVKESNIIHHNEYDYSKTFYKCNNKPVIITCPIHGDFLQRPKDHLNGQGCPRCKQSKIEKEISDFLSGNNITFKSQYKYDETNSKNSLDFYLPDYNVAIECQGEQHFKPVDFANKGKKWAEELFQKNIERDLYKNKLCEEKGIKLLYYIPKKNTIPGYKKNICFNGLYNNKNVFNNLKQLKKGLSFDNI